MSAFRKRQKRREKKARTRERAKAEQTEVKPITIEEIRRGLDEFFGSLPAPVPSDPMSGLMIGLASASKK